MKDLNKGDRYGNNRLMVAVMENEFSKIETLIGAGINVDRRNKKGQTALWKACELGATKIARYLVEKNVDLDIEDNKKNTPLLVAIYKHNVDLVKLLLDQDAAVNKKTIEEASKNLEIINLFVERKKIFDLMRHIPEEQKDYLFRNSIRSNNMELLKLGRVSLYQVCKFTFF